MHTRWTLFSNCTHRQYSPIGHKTTSSTQTPQKPKHLADSQHTLENLPQVTSRALQPARRVTTPAHLMSPDHGTYARIHTDANTPTDGRTDALTHTHHTLGFGFAGYSFLILVQLVSLPFAELPIFSINRRVRPSTEDFAIWHAEEETWPGLLSRVPLTSGRELPTGPFLFSFSP